MPDKLIQVGDGATAMRLKDMGDGSMAVVIMAGSSSVSTAGDKLIQIGDGTIKGRLRDMGDGTVAEVFFGV